MAKHVKASRMYTFIRNFTDIFMCESLLENTVS